MCSLPLFLSSTLPLPGREWLTAFSGVCDTIGGENWVQGIERGLGIGEWGTRDRTQGQDSQVCWIFDFWRGGHNAFGETLSLWRAHWGSLPLPGMDSTLRNTTQRTSTQRNITQEQHSQEQYLEAPRSCCSGVSECCDFYNLYLK